MRCRPRFPTGVLALLPTRPAGARFSGVLRPQPASLLGRWTQQNLLVLLCSLSILTLDASLLAVSGRPPDSSVIPSPCSIQAPALPTAGDVYKSSSSASFLFSSSPNRPWLHPRPPFGESPSFSGAKPAKQSRPCRRITPTVRSTRAPHSAQSPARSRSFSTALYASSLLKM